MAELASTAEQIENAVRYNLGTRHAKVQPSWLPPNGPYPNGYGHLLPNRFPPWETRTGRRLVLDHPWPRP